MAGSAGQPAAGEQPTCCSCSCQAAVDEDASQAGGGVVQTPGPGNHGPPPDLIRQHMLEATCASYRAKAFADGIPFRRHGLFPPSEPLLARLAADPELHPFEKKMSGLEAPSEQLTRGGWATGDAAAQHGMDLRLFFQEPGPGEEWGSLRGAVRFGDGAAIGNGLWTTAHGGAIESVLDEATAELAKCCFCPLVSTREASFGLLKPAPLHTTLAVSARIKEVRGIRCYVEGAVRLLVPGSAEEGPVVATGSFLLIDMTSFI